MRIIHSFWDMLVNVGKNADRRRNKKLQNRSLRVESLETRQLLTISTGSISDSSLAANYEIQGNANIDAAQEDPFSLASDNESVGDEAAVETSEVAWNLANYNYSAYSVDAGIDETAGTWVALYGIDGGGRTLLEKTEGLTTDAVLTITGDSSKAESVEITGNGTIYLPNFVFDGGTVDKNNPAQDSLTVQGNATDDVYSFDSITVENEDSSENQTNRRNSDDRSWASRWDRWNKDRDRRDDRTTSTQTATINYSWVENETSFEGVSIQATGVKTIFVDGADGDDVFNVRSLASNVSLSDSDKIAGNDVLDFSNASTNDDSNVKNKSRRSWDDWGWNGWDWGDWHWNSSDWNGWDWGDWHWGGRFSRVDGVSVDLDSSDWQTVSQSWSGKLQLDGNIKTFVGSTQSDRISGSDVKITEASDANKIRLTGGDNEVVVSGDRNDVSAKGTGNNSITVTGNNNKVDLSRTEATATNIVSVSGERNKIRGGASAEQITISGSRNRVNAGDGDDKIVVEGSENNVSGGKGNDVVWAVLSTGRNRYSGDSGNDIIFGGSGNDRIDGGSGRNVLIGSTGADSLFGRGTNVFVANRTNLLENMEDWTEQERSDFLAAIYDEWVVNEDMEATIELLGETSVADGAKDRLRRGRRTNDNLFYLNSSDDDWSNARSFDPWNDQIFDDE